MNAPLCLTCGQRGTHRIDCADAPLSEQEAITAHHMDEYAAGLDDVETMDEASDYEDTGFGGRR